MTFLTVRDNSARWRFRQGWRRIRDELRRLRSPALGKLRSEFSEFTERMLGGFALSCGRQRWAVKRPTYLYSHIDEIHAIHPNMKFVHVVRDGRDVIASIMRQPWARRTPTRFDYAIRVWTSEMSRGDMVGMQASLIERAADVYWAGAARMTIKADPDVLT